MTTRPANVRPAPDKVIADIAAYVDRYQVKSELAFETAHYCLIDSLGCGFEALAYPACTKPGNRPEAKCLLQQEALEQPWAMH